MALALVLLFTLSAPDAVAGTDLAAEVTPAGTRIPDGELCSTPIDCNSGFCVDGVCCDSACDGVAESCNQSGRMGTCSPLPAPAPPLSRKGLFSIIALLTAFGILSFSRRRRLGAAATHG